MPAKVTQPWKIAYVLKTLDDPYWQRVGKAAQALGEELSINVQIEGTYNPPNSEFVEEQIVLISRLLEQEDLDGIVVGPTDSIRLVPIIEKAAAKGIPVIAIDTPVSSENILTFVGFDNFVAGESVGQWVVEQLGGAGNILILEGPKHHDNAIERHKGFLAGLRTGKIKILASQSARWDLKEAQDLTEKWLAQYPKVDAIIAANDNMALGAVAAIQSGNYSNILVAGFDGSKAGLAAVQSQELDATIDQPPEEQSQITMQL
ncbi:MAG: sugar ABC transporter substrate-binding protein, partial [Cyanobacteria bacterium P01_F01_bin.153]